MNAREKNLLIILIGVVGSILLLVVVYKWWWTPFKAYSDTIGLLESDNDKNEAILDDFLKGQVKMQQASLRSLPTTWEKAQVEYGFGYLKPMLKDCGLEVADVQSSAAPQKLKPVTPITNVKEVGHLILTFTVRANGDLASLVKAMDVMQRTPYEHRIKSLTVDRDPSEGKKTSGKLSILMVVETLLVAGNKNVPGPPRMPDMSKKPGERDYSLLAKRNPFIGALPPSPGDQAKTGNPKGGKNGGKNGGKDGNGDGTTQDSDPDYVPAIFTPAFVYLTHTSPDEQTAYVRNRIYKTANLETKLIAKPGSGYDTFRITDEEGTYEFFRAKVLRVELRAVCYQVVNKVYRVDIGKSLGDAQELSFSLTRIELEDLGLYDRAFEKEELARLAGKTKEKGNSKKTGKRGG